MSAFTDANDALFADANLALAATLRVEGGSTMPIKVVARRPDRILEFGDARLHSTAAMFDLRVSEVPEPRPGDRLEIAGESYVIQGEPVRDAERLVWTVSAVPL